jgi:hypothetical protein
LPARAFLSHSQAGPKRIPTLNGDTISLSNVGGMVYLNSSKMLYTSLQILLSLVKAEIGKDFCDCFDMIPVLVGMTG